MPAWDAPKNDYSVGDLIPGAELNKMAGATIHNHEDLILSGGLGGGTGGSYLFPGGGVANSLLVQSIAYDLPDQHRLVLRRVNAFISGNTIVNGLVKGTGFLSYTDYTIDVQGAGTSYIAEEPNLTMATNTLGGTLTNEIIEMRLYPYAVASLSTRPVDYCTWTLKFGIEAI